MELVQLLNLLQSLRTRVRVLSVIFGVGIVLAGLIVMLLGMVGVDYLLNLPAGPRVFLILVMLGALCYGLFRWIVRPLLARMSLGDVAGRLERAFPQFDDRLRSTVNFSEQAAIPGSEMMKRRVIVEASQIALTTDLNRAIETRPVWYSAGAAGLAVAILAALVLTASPQMMKIALSRVFTPFNSLAWPKSVQIAMVGEVPRVVPEGARVPIRIRLERGDSISRKPILYYKNADGIEQSEYLIRAEDGTYSANIDAKASSEAALGKLNVRLVAGDDERFLDSISIVPRLMIQSIDAVVAPPAYSGQASSTANLATGPIVVTAGSTVELQVGFNKTLDNAQAIALDNLKTSAAPGGVKWNRSGNRLAVATFMVMESSRFHLHAYDTDGFTNLGVEEYEILVRPDQLPLVQIENPRRNEERTPVAVVPLQALAEDDFGISLLQLIVTRLGDKKQWTINLTKDGSWQAVDSSADRKRFRINYAWDLTKLAEAKLQSGDVLEYYLTAYDNYELNGQKHPPANSGKLRITIVSQEEFAQHIAEELRAAAYQIFEIRAMQNRTGRETENFRKDTENKDKLDPADRAVAERLAVQQATAASQSRQISTKLQAIRATMEENKSEAADLKATAKDAGDILDAAAEKPMKQATNKLNEAREPKESAKDRNQALEDAKQNQKEAADQLQRALDRMGNIGTLAQTIDTFRGILAEQQKISAQTADIGKKNLGKTPEQMSPEDRKKLEKNAQDQADLSKQTEKAIEEMSKQAEQMSKSDPSASDAMKKAAETGRQQQVSSNQSKAAQSAQQNQQASAQAAQKQAELGLEMILGTLREAERRKLEELSKKLAELQQQLQNLIKRQAGHNLDDLALQGAEHIAKLDEKTLANLLEASGRVKENLPPPPTIPQLSAGQEQTERNTRDIGQRVEEMPDSAETASQLTRAAERMQRAIVFLRDSKLSDAYDPPMVDALAALQQAKKIVDDQKKDADKKQEDQQKDSIRVVYEKIKADQEKLNADTKRIDQSPKLEDGSLRREEAVRLGQLPGEEGKLSDMAEGLNEALSGLGSVVYVWANKDLVRTMKDVKDQLGQSKTDAPTQAQQKKIVDQLEAMIRNLSIKPKEEDFAKRESGGGGGGGGGPKLPSEAELRLLKDLQLGVSGGTKQADAALEKDPKMLMELGGRQGEMRNLLDQLLQKSSQGKLRLGAEPDNKDQLPEEVSRQQVEDQELEQQLLSDKPDAEKIEKDARLIGDRMARSRQRLALNNDPGKTTQIIQERIIQNLDILIDQARKQQGGSSMAQKPGEGQQAKPADGKNGKPQNSNGKQQANSGQTPAATDNPGGQGQSPADLSKEIKEKQSEWGGLTPRQRAAVMEGAGETVIEKYRKLIDDYYRTLATKATEK